MDAPNVFVLLDGLLQFGFHWIRLLCKQRKEGTVYKEETIHKQKGGKSMPPRKSIYECPCLS